MITADAQFFWANHPGGQAWCDLYRETGNLPQRDWALAAVKGFGPVTSVLEVGCHCGPLLRRLAALDGMERAIGLDINAEAIAQARATGLQAIVGTIPGALQRFPDRLFDVVVSSYCLAYVAPQDLAFTLSECLRIARLGLVLVEPTAGPGVDPAIYEDGQYVEWRHEYLDALSEAHGRLPIRPVIEVTRTRKGTRGSYEINVTPHAGVNAVITARITWRS